MHGGRTHQEEAAAGQRPGGEPGAHLLLADAVPQGPAHLVPAGLTGWRGRGDIRHKRCRNAEWNDADPLGRYPQVLLDVAPDAPAPEPAERLEHLDPQRADGEIHPIVQRAVRPDDVVGIAPVSIPIR